MNDNFDKNSILSKFRRSDGPYLPTGRANAFFGEKYVPRIISITNELIQYTDLNGSPKEVLLSECHNCPETIQGYVGNRGILSSPPWIEFFDTPNTRFEFESRKDAFRYVLDKLAKLGIKTIDVD